MSKPKEYIYEYDVKCKYRRYDSDPEHIPVSVVSVDRETARKQVAEIMHRDWGEANYTFSYSLVSIMEIKKL